MENLLSSVNIGKLNRLVPPKPEMTLMRKMTASGVITLITFIDIRVIWTCSDDHLQMREQDGLEIHRLLISIMRIYILLQHYEHTDVLTYPALLSSHRITVVMKNCETARKFRDGNP